MENFTEAVSTILNVTSTPKATARPRVRGTPPPPGYYGDTKEMMWKVIPPIIIAWGIVGNFLTILVLSRLMRKKVSSTSLYLMALALSDTIILLCGPLRNFIKYIWEKDVRYMTDAGCRAQVYFTYASIHMSSWLLVAVTMERVISVILPHKVKMGCTPKIAGIVIFVIFLVVYSLNICVAVINGRDAYVKSFLCAPTSKEFLDFRDNIWQWIDFCVAFAIPFLILLIGNVIIVVQLSKSRKRQREMNATRGTGSTSVERKTKSLSVLLIFLCVIFFLTMTPVSIFNIYYPYRFEEIKAIKNRIESWYAYQYMLFQHSIVNLVGYTNASFNFILYVLSGSKFRTELMAMLCFWRKSESKSSFTVKTRTTNTGSSYTSSVRPQQTVSGGDKTTACKDKSVLLPASYQACVNEGADSDLTEPGNSTPTVERKTHNTKDNTSNGSCNTKRYVNGAYEPDEGQNIENGKKVSDIIPGENDVDTATKMGQSLDDACEKEKVAEKQNDNKPLVEFSKL